MTRIAITGNTRITREGGNGPVRTWFDQSDQPALKDFEPRALARATLKENADIFGLPGDLASLVDGPLVRGHNVLSVRFTQEFKEVPVDSSETVVNIYDDGRVYSIYNNYHFDIPAALNPRKVKVSAARSRELVQPLVARHERHEISGPALIVYRYHRIENHPKHRSSGGTDVFITAAALAAATGTTHKEGQYFLAWDVRIVTARPTGHVRVLLDASTGEIIQVIDLLQYVNGTGGVFDPNPVVTSGDLTLSHSTALATLNAQRQAVTLERLDAASAGTFRLHGSNVQMEDFASPTVAEPLSATGDFTFNPDTNGFLDAMAYFHIDRFQNYIQTTLGLNNVCNRSIHVDPQGFGGADNSQYSSATKKLELGGGILPAPADNPIPDASDAMVVLHEYGHAIQDDVNPGFDNPTDGTGEGFGDFLSAVYYDDKHVTPASTRGIMMSWDANTTDHSWPGRRYDVAWLFDGPEYAGSNDNHIRGQLWCATMFQLYRKLGGDSAYAGVKSAARDLAIRLHLMANFNVPASGSSAMQMGQQVEAADSNLGGWRYANGLHKKVIYDTFRRRHLPGYPDKAVDVYINDGRHGGYGSLSGNDAFTEKQWLDNYWETQDLWVTVTPYASAADQAAGDPGDHVEPPVNSTAYLYVRVKNLGTDAAGSGPVTVKAFHCTPGMGLVWPIDWTPMDTASIAVPNILPGAANAVVVGPFPWTPTLVGHECVLAVAECAADHAITQDLLPTDQVAHSNLVPFDNNIAQRNLVPTDAKTKTVRGFHVRNPDDKPRTVKLHVESSLPRGWQYHLNVPDANAIHLAARERRWIELTIDPADGAEVTTFAVPERLDITGLIDGRVIGGMSFYLAPPSAFPGAPGTRPPHESSGPFCASDLASLNIPWNECDVEGEITIKIRFHTRKRP